MTDTETQVSPISEAETSAVKALKLVAKKELTGRLTIKYLNSEVSGWQAYFAKGNLQYATSTVANEERISYLLSRFFPDLETKSFPGTIDEEYNYLTSYWLSGKISVQEMRKIIYTLTQEALSHCLAAPPVELSFEDAEELDPAFLSVSPKELANPIRPKVLSWLKLQSLVQCPLYRVGIEDVKAFNNAIAEHSEWSKLKPLSKSLAKFPTLYQLAKKCQVDALGLAQKLSPLVTEKYIQVKPYEQVQAEKEAPIVACIDDSHTVQKNVRLTLETAGYEVLSITDPTHALSALARKKPVLILMDITMPVSGYELSRLLRQSESLADVPIVMLTGRDGVVDRVRARMVGATEYITKPFNPDQLVQKVRQFSMTHLVRKKS